VTNGMIAGSLSAVAGSLFCVSYRSALTLVAQAEGPPGVNRLTEFGLAGSLMAVIVYIVYLLLNRTLTGRETDLAWHRDEMARRTTLFQSVIDDTNKLHEKNIAHLSDRMTASLEKIDARLGSRTEDILKILEAMRSVNMVMEGVKDMLSYCRDVQIAKGHTDKD